MARPPIRPGDLEVPTPASEQEMGETEINVYEPEPGQYWSPFNPPDDDEVDAWATDVGAREVERRIEAAKRGEVE